MDLDGRTDAGSIDLDRLLDDSNIDSDGFVRLRDFDYEASLIAERSPLLTVEAMPIPELHRNLDRWPKHRCD